MDKLIEAYIVTSEHVGNAIWQLRLIETDALNLARTAQFPKKVRPATAKDIVIGNVIWYKEGDDGPFWQIIERVLHPDDSFKAYMAEGSRYGLDGAFVEVE